MHQLITTTFKILNFGKLRSNCHLTERWTTSFRQLWGKIIKKKFRKRTWKKVEASLQRTTNRRRTKLTDEQQTEKIKTHRSILVRLEISEQRKLAFYQHFFDNVFRCVCICFATENSLDFVTESLNLRNSLAIWETKFMELRKEMRRK